MRRTTKQIMHAFTPPWHITELIILYYGKSSKTIMGKYSTQGWQEGTTIPARQRAEYFMSAIIYSIITISIIIIKVITLIIITNFVKTQ